MKKATILKRGILGILLLLFFAPLAFCDVIYLKDGSVLRGRITEESNKTIVVEGADWWRVLGRSEIEKITYQVETVVEPKEYIKVERRDPVIITQASPGITVLAGLGALFLILLIIAAL